MKRMAIKDVFVQISEHAEAVEKPIINTLSDVLQELAGQYRLEFIVLPEDLEPHFKPSGFKNDCCVDGRGTITYLDDGIAINNNRYLLEGIHLPGGSFAIIDALKEAADLNEEEAKDIIRTVYQENGWLLGDHIDNEHGHISDQSELDQRTDGCGNLKVKKGREISIYAGEEIDPAERINWLRENRGLVLILAGEHQEQGAIINLKNSVGFDGAEALEKGQSYFDLDLRAVYDRLGKIYTKLVNPEKSREDFVKEMLRNILIDYIETLDKLGALVKIERKLYLAY